MTRDERRALRLLASEAHGVTEAPMLAHGFRREMLAGLVLAGLVTVVQRRREPAARGLRSIATRLQMTGVPRSWPTAGVAVEAPLLGTLGRGFCSIRAPTLQMGPVAPMAWKKFGFLTVRHVTPLVRAAPVRPFSHVMCSSQAEPGASFGRHRIPHRQREKPIFRCCVGLRPLCHDLSSMVACPGSIVASLGSRGGVPT